MADFFVDQGINLVLSQVFGNHFFIVVKKTTEPWLKKAGRNMRLKKGDFVLILPDEKHQYENRSLEDPFMTICAVPKEYE